MRFVICTCFAVLGLLFSDQASAQWQQLDDDACPILVRGEDTWSSGRGCEWFDDLRMDRYRKTLKVTRWVDGVNRDRRANIHLVRLSDGAGWGGWGKLSSRISWLFRPEEKQLRFEDPQRRQAPIGEMTVQRFALRNMECVGFRHEWGARMGSSNWHIVALPNQLYGYLCDKGGLDEADIDGFIAQIGVRDYHEPAVPDS